MGRRESTVRASTVQQHLSILSCDSKSIQSCDSKSNFKGSNVTLNEDPGVVSIVHRALALESPLMLKFNTFFCGARRRPGPGL